MSRSQSAVARWSAAKRMGFRFAFCYLLQFVLAGGHKTLLGKLPLVGAGLERGLALPYGLAAEWLGRHLFHLQGVAATLHPSGFADRALDWIAGGVMLVAAAVATAVWTILAERKATRSAERIAYPQLTAWLRFGLRLSLAVAMLWYGSIKLWPVQIESPSLAVLNEPVGQLSPMTLLWTLLGYSHNYERVCGAIETLCALLLLFRRTALAGALLAAFVMTNVLLFDCFFDVPVKLYAANLLLMALVLIAPDLRSLWGYFWRHQASAPAGSFALPQGPRAVQVACGLLEVMVLLVAVKPVFRHQQYSRESANERHPAAIAGQWHIDSAMRPGSDVAEPLLTGDGQAATDLFFEPSGRDTLRAVDGTLWSGASYDATHARIELLSPRRALLGYAILQPDEQHLVLQPDDAAWPELRLTRMPLPGSYPLYQRGWHWTNEWGYER